MSSHALSFKISLFYYILAILSKKFTASNISLHNIQKDMRLAIDSGDTHGQALHVAASANEVRVSKSITPICGSMYVVKYH